MKRNLILYLLIFLLLIGCRAESDNNSKFNAGVRSPAVSGRFYSDDQDKLKGAIDTFLSEAIEAKVEDAVGIIVPHAGYIFSGQIAADAFKQVCDNKYDLIVILGTNHTTQGFNGVSIYPDGAYKTPLGKAVIDAGVAGELINFSEDFTYNPTVHVREHSVEVQIPFIQHIFPETKIVCAVIGKPDPDLCKRFGIALAEVVRDKKTLIVASSDLSHYPGYSDALDADQNILNAIVKMDASHVKSTVNKQMKRGISELSTCACGEGPILTLIAAAKKLGAKNGLIVSYGNSGDVAVGDRSRVVGYGAVVFSRGEGTLISNTPLLVEHAPDSEFSPVNRQTLLNLVRRTISQYLTTNTVPFIRDLDPALEINRGAFVTLKKHGDLRGCIGHMLDDQPIGWIVSSMAMQSAFQDRRFNPVTQNELEEIEIEISVLTPYKRVSGYKDIVIGRDGVVVRKKGRSAVYLPQVAIEQGWDLSETLSHLCRKAGLPVNAWKSDAEFLTFQAEVFSESDFH